MRDFGFESSFFIQTKDNTTVIGKRLDIESDRRTWTLEQIHGFARKISTQRCNVWSANVWIQTCSLVAWLSISWPIVISCTEACFHASCAHGKFPLYVILGRNNKNRLTCTSLPNTLIDRSHFKIPIQIDTVSAATTTTTCSWCSDVLHQVRPAMTKKSVGWALFNAMAVSAYNPKLIVWTKHQIGNCSVSWTIQKKTLGKVKGIMLNALKAFHRQSLYP